MPTVGVGVIGSADLLRINYTTGNFMFFFGGRGVLCDDYGRKSGRFSYLTK